MTHLDEHVVTMKRPSQQQPPRMMESMEAINNPVQPGYYQQGTPSEKTPNINMQR
jgi:hypothetical protein